MEVIGSQAKKVIRAYSDKVAVTFKKRTITYQELYDRSMAVASFLRNRGLNKGERVGILTNNRLECIELDLAIAFGGFVKVPLNAKLHANEHKYMLEDAEVSILIGEEHLTKKIETTIPTLLFGNEYDAIIEQYNGKVIEEEVNENDLYAIMYTSGTTGKPKGVMLSHRNTLSSAYSLGLICEVNNEDIIGHVAPLTHGSNFLSHMSWFHGTSQVIYDKYNPEEFIDDIEKDKVSVIFLVPTMVNLMIQHPQFDPQKLTSIKSINMAGSSMPVSRLQKTLDLIGTRIVQTFGQMEAPMCITVMPRNEMEHRLESCGRTGPFVEMKIIDAEGNELPSGEVGEIVCKGSLVMQGYWNNEKATKETLVDGWLRTGDLGWVDKQGYLHIVDRIKDVIISGGYNIYPREIEEVLNKHDGVKEISVIGVPDEKWGEAVIVFVVPNGITNVSEEDLLNLCTNHLARFKKPKEIYFVDKLPKNAYGKILKRELRKQYFEMKGQTTK